MPLELQQPEKGDRRLFKLLRLWAEDVASRKTRHKDLPRILAELEGIVNWKAGETLANDIFDRLRYWYGLANSRYRNRFSVVTFREHILAVYASISTSASAVASADALADIAASVRVPLPSNWKEAQESTPNLLRAKDNLSNISESESLSLLDKAILEALESIPEDTVLDTLKELPVLTGEPEYEWEMVLGFKTGSLTGSSFGLLIWAISESLESIPGVEVLLESAESGSVVTKFLVNIQNRESCKELIEFLRDALKQLAQNHSSNSTSDDGEEIISDARTSISTSLKEQKELESIVSDLASGGATEEDLNRAKALLELRGAALDLVERHQKIETQRLNNLKALSGLVSEGFILAGPGSYLNINEVRLVCSNSSDLEVNPDDVDYIDSSGDDS